MKLSILLLGLVSSFNLIAQEIDVKISGSIFSTGADSIYLAQFNGQTYTDYAAAPMDKNGAFEIKASVPAPDYYILRMGKQHLNLILREGSDIKIYGDGSQLIDFVNFIGSDESQQMNEYLRIQNDWDQKKIDAMNRLQADPSKKAEIDKEMKGAYNMFNGQQRNFLSKNVNSAALLPILNSIDANKDFETYEAITAQLVNGFGQSPTIQQLATNVEALKKERYANDPLAPGKPAPDFEELKTDGTTTMKLSDLKGKVVLLDFWASWCGPCRRENPSVVKLYEQYKDDGFTVMSVSLDKDKNRWLQAIEQDGLVWPNHVSDLNYWSSKAAKLYGVGSIPFTVLIDQEGNIVKTKLRGPALEQELQRIFGH